MVVPSECMAKRYDKDEVPIVEKHDCIACDRIGRTGAKSLVADGWLSTSKGLLCPSCPSPEE